MVRRNVLIQLTIVAVTASACAQQKTMTLAAADAELFDPEVPVEIVGAHAISRRHGYVVAGVGEGVGTGMLSGTVAAIGGGAQTGDPLGLALGVVLSPVFAVGGGVYGAASAHSTEETEGAIAAIDAVYDDSILLGSIDEEVQAAFEAEGFSVVRECGARALIEASILSADQEAIAAPDCDLTNVKSRLRLEESFAFTTHGTYSPDLIFVINVDAVASSSDPSMEAKDFRWVYISPKMDFFDATSSGAADLRQHIAAAQARLARRIVEDLHTARREIRVTGTYWPDRDGVNFMPAAASPGLVMRAPARSQLINVSKAELN